MDTHIPSKRPPKRHRVLVVDRHPITRHGLVGLINTEADLAVCGEGADVEQALDAVQTLHPDLVVAELALREGSGLDLITDLQRCVPGIAILVLSMLDEMLYAERVLRARARGYVMKQAALEEVLTAIRQVLRSGRAGAKMLLIYLYAPQGLVDEVVGRFGGLGTSFAMPLHFFPGLPDLKGFHGL